MEHPYPRMARLATGTGVYVPSYGVPFLGVRLGVSH